MNFIKRYIRNQIRKEIALKQELLEDRKRIAALRLEFKKREEITLTKAREVLGELKRVGCAVLPTEYTPSTFLENDTEALAIFKYVNKELGSDLLAKIGGLPAVTHSMGREIFSISETLKNILNTPIT